MKFMVKKVLNGKPNRLKRCNQSQSRQISATIDFGAELRPWHRIRFWKKTSSSSLKRSGYVIHNFINLRPYTNVSLQIQTVGGVSDNWPIFWCNFFLQPFTKSNLNSVVNTYECNQGKKEFYRYLQLRRTGKDSSNHDYLSLSEVEFFGLVE